MRKKPKEELSLLTAETSNLKKIILIILTNRELSIGVPARVPMNINSFPQQ